MSIIKDEGATPPIHLTRRQAVWAGAAALVFDFVAVRLIFPWLLTQPSSIALGAAIVGAAALVAAHVDILWCIAEPAPPKVRCNFCRKLLAPSEITTMERFGAMWRTCNDDKCRVSFAKATATALVQEPRR